MDRGRLAVQPQAEIRLLISFSFANSAASRVLFLVLQL